MTRSPFTDDARQLVGQISRGIVPIDGQALSRLMYDHGIGVRGQRRYEVRRVDAAAYERDA